MSLLLENQDAGGEPQPVQADQEGATTGNQGQVTPPLVETPPILGEEKDGDTQGSSRQRVKGFSKKPAK